MAEPSEVNRLKMMISQFRVSELTSLLQSQNRPKTGRKRELMERALELLEGQVTSGLKNKIVELDQHRNPSHIGRPAFDAYGAVGGSSYVSSDLIDQLYQSSHVVNQLQTAAAAAAAASLGPYPKVEPGVKFRPLAFFDQIELIQKTGKVPGNGTRVAGTQFYIRIPNTAMQKFVQGQTPTREKYSFQIRFADMSPISMGSSVLADEIPTTLRLKVNDREPELPPHIPPSKAGVDPKRQKRPIQITPQIRSLIERGAANDLPHVDISVSAQWKEDGSMKREWAITVELSEQITSDVLLERIKQFKIPREDTLAIIRDKLDPDSDVAMTSIRVSLLCPVGCLRMTTPSRTKKCNHLQCFDANLYLKMNEKKPTWQCPVCHRDAYFNDLIVDEYFIEICQQSKSDEIDFQEDGAWKEHYDKKEQPAVKEKKKTPIIHSVNLDDSDDDDDEENEKENDAQVALISKQDDCIVLSSDDDEPPLQQPTKRARLDPAVSNGNGAVVPGYHGEMHSTVQSTTAVVILSSSEDEEEEAEGLRQKGPSPRPDEPLNLISTESDSDQLGSLDEDSDDDFVPFSSTRGRQKTRV